MKSSKSKKVVSSFAFESGSMLLPRAVILTLLSAIGIVVFFSGNSAIARNSDSWESKPVIVNIQVDLGTQDDQQAINNILAEIERHNGHATVFVTGEFASLHPDIVRWIEARQHQIAVHGWQTGEDLSVLSSTEQVALIEAAFSAVRSAVDKPENVVDFKPQGYKFSVDTIRILQKYGARSISGLFPFDESFCECWHIQSLGKITFPYPITTEFWAVPISEYGVGAGAILLDDSHVQDASDYLAYLITEFNEQSETKEPVIIVVHPAITGADEAWLQAFSQFLSYVKSNNGKIATLDSICHFTTYITNFNATGPSSAYVAEQITINVTYTSNIWCPNYRFRAYGKYPGEEWKLLDSHCEFVYLGGHSFNLQALIPAPPEGQNTYTIRVVGRASFGGCSPGDYWPTYNSHEVSKEFALSVLKPVKIEEITVTGIPDAKNPMTNDPSTSVVEEIKLEAKITTTSGYEVTKVSWSGDIVPGEGNPYKYIAAPTTEHGWKTVICTVTYRNKVTGATAPETGKKQFKLFFVKTGHEDGPSKPPNWFKYWSKIVTSSLLGTPKPTMVYSSSSYFSPGTTEIHLSDGDSGTYTAPEGLHNPLEGIDNFVWTVVHESQHYAWWKEWWANNPATWNAAKNKAGPNDDKDSDTNPNKVEDLDLDGVFDPPTEKYDWTKYLTSGAPAAIINDHEWKNSYDHRDVTGSAYHKMDWANPGKQSNHPPNSPSLSQGQNFKELIPVLLPTATFNNTYSSYGTDTNGNGLYDYLSIEIGVSVTVAGKYNIAAGLQDGNGNTLLASSYTDLGMGDQLVLLNFDGLTIHQNRVDGPYNVIDLILYDENGGMHDCMSNAHITSPYKYTEFEKPIVEFTNTYSDYGVDTDGDGLYDCLAVEVGLDVAVSGNYFVEGGLYGSQGKAIEIASTSASLDVGSQSITLNFRGLLINQHQVDGPYYLRYVSLSGSPQLDFILDAYTTSAYSYGDFESGVLPQTGVTGTIMDYSGSLVPNALIQVSGPKEDSTHTDENGDYGLVDLEPGSYTITVTPDPYDNLMPTSAWVSIPVEQIITRDFVLNQAGSIGGAVTDSGGNPVPGVGLYLSGYEPPIYATDEEGKYIIPSLQAGTHTINIDAPGWGPWYILVNGSYVSDQRLYSTTVVVNLGQTTWVAFTQQPPPQPDIWVDPASFEVTLYVGNIADRILIIGNDGTDPLQFNISEAKLYFYDNIESGEDGWTHTGLWHITEHRSQSPTHAWYYGREGYWNYDMGRNYGFLTTPPINLTDALSPVLTFWRWESTEGGSYYDYRHVYISANNGASWNNIYISQGLNQGEWIKETIDLSGYAGNIVLLRFQFDTIDSLYNYYEGWYVDDVIVSGGGTIDWLSESPTTDSVNPGEQTDVTVTVDSTDLQVSEYRGYIVINSNDLDEGVIYIPVQLSVIEPVLVDNLVSISAGRAGYDRRTGQFSVDVTVTNTSNTAIGTPVWLVIESISNPAVTVAGGDGMTIDGKPYVDCSGLLGNGQLDPAETISKRIYFNNPNRVQFTFKPSVRGVIVP